MNKTFEKKLKEYLDSECSDFDMTYQYEWNEDTECCEVEIKRDDYTQYTKYLNFKYNNNELEVELSEDSFYITREWDYTVKYFWMLVAPALFPDK